MITPLLQNHSKICYRRYHWHTRAVATAYSSIIHRPTMQMKTGVHSGVSLQFHVLSPSIAKMYNLNFTALEEAKSKTGHLKHVYNKMKVFVIIDGFIYSFKAPAPTYHRDDKMTNKIVSDTVHERRRVAVKLIREEHSKYHGKYFNNE